MREIDERIERLERITNLQHVPAWKALREEAQERLEAKEASFIKMMMTSRKEVDTGEIEYARGFRQGIKFVLDGIPNGAGPEAIRLAAKQSEETADE